MLIAKQKRKENIVEYILYLYQIEDLIRAFKFDITSIQKNLVSKYNADTKLQTEITDWYSNLLIMMDKEKIRSAGHLQFLKNLVNDLNEFHLMLIETESDKKYKQIYQSVAGLLTELKQKNTRAENQIDLGLSSVYGFLLLKMKKATISNETSEAIKRISDWLALLSKLYSDFEKGDLEMNE